MPWWFFRRAGQPESLTKLSALPYPFLAGSKLIVEGSIQAQFPIDVVYTWVDSKDPEFQTRLNKFQGGQKDFRIVGESRFKNYDELRYSLRSLEYYAPWINHIYIVTAGQRPGWLANHPRVTVIDHAEILSAEYLPTFNSHVIGSALHKIPNLSEHYIYFNDDVMLLRPAEPADFFSSSGLAYGFISRLELPAGGPINSETATNWGAKNARSLIRREWGVELNRRFSHSAHPQLKSVAIECEKRFSAEYHAFRQNKFRAINDLLVCSYLHIVAGYMMKQFIFISGKELTVYQQIRNHASAYNYTLLLQQQDTAACRLFGCFNDNEPPYPLDGYQDHFIQFLETYFPFKSSFEAD